MKLQADSLIQEISNIELAFAEREEFHEDYGMMTATSIVRVNDLRFKFGKKNDHKAIDGYREHMTQVYDKFEESVLQAVQTSKSKEKIINDLELILGQFIRLDEIFVFKYNTEYGLDEFRDGCNIQAKVFSVYGKQFDFWYNAYYTMPFFKIQRNFLDRAKRLISLTIEDIKANQSGNESNLPTTKLIWNSTTDLFFIFFSVLIKKGYLVEGENKSSNISKIANVLFSFIQVEKNKGGNKEYTLSSFEKFLKSSEYVTLKGNSFSPKGDNHERGYAFKRLAEMLDEILDGLEKNE